MDKPEITLEERKVNIFYSYSHRDEDLRLRFEVHMAGLKRKGMIEEWHDRKILSGQNFENIIDKNLMNADIVIFFVSADFIASDYCYNHEVIKSVERHNQGHCTVVPVILRECDWEGAPFESIHGLPTDMKPVVSRHWNDTDEAFANIVRELKKIIKKKHSDKEKRNFGSTKKSIKFILRSGLSGQEFDIEAPSSSTVRELLNKLIKSNTLEKGPEYIFILKYNSMQLDLDQTLFDCQVRDGDTILASTTTSLN